jgi:hypothetical protein
LTAPILGRPLSELRPLASRAVVAAARAYLQQAGEPVPEASHASLFLAGHQPELVHPGVWVKNFALHALAKLNGATPVHLVVDNDTVKATSLRLPLLDAAESRPHPALVSFDRWSGEVPYEERRVVDEALFAGLPDQVALLVRTWPFKPFLPAFWGEVARQASRTPLLGERIAAARRSFERAWGCHNLEVPLSAVCKTEFFAWFACHVLADLRRFHAVYNDCLREYRRIYGIRSRAHPVPDLAVSDGWLEAPFWAWRVERPHRVPLLARSRGQEVELRFGKESGGALPLASPQNVEAAVAAWQSLEAHGIKVRTRALTTTLFSRLFLGDLFVHGIGGAKYDELTDEIIRRFYGFEPPRYLVLSGTLRLPLPILPASADEGRKLAHDLRDVQCNPQRHLENGAALDPRARSLAAKKLHWIAEQPATSDKRRERFHVLKDLTNQLRPFLADRERELEDHLSKCDKSVQANAVLQRRDYAFCLFPEEVLRPFCTRFQE